MDCEHLRDKKVWYLIYLNIKYQFSHGIFLQNKTMRHASVICE